MLLFAQICTLQGGEPRTFARNKYDSLLEKEAVLSKQVVNCVVETPATLFPLLRSGLTVALCCRLFRLRCVDHRSGRRSHGPTSTERWLCGPSVSVSTSPFWSCWSAPVWVSVRRRSTA